MTLQRTLAVGLVGLLAVFAGCSSSSDTTTEENTTTEETTSTVATGANAKTEVGVSFEAEGVKHTINYVLDNWENPYDEYHFESADEGYKMVSVNITVENIGTEEADTSNLYYLLHFGGAEPSEMSFYGGGTQDVDTNLTRFPADNPVAVGGTYTGDLLFEVSESTTLSDWTLEYNSDFLDFYDDNEVVMTPLSN